MVLAYNEPIVLGHRVASRNYTLNGDRWDWSATGVVRHIGQHGFLKIQWDGDEEYDEEESDVEVPFVSVLPYKVMADVHNTGTPVAVLF